MDISSESISQTGKTVDFDYSFVRTPARVACYDDFKTAPRITIIEPTTTAEFIENLTTTIYNQSHTAGGKIPYTVIREVSENFIHANFTEIIVSILDEGNTIRFADQGPGISQKEKAQLPGFSSAIEPMKKYIRGVGSGLPIVKDYLDSSQGTITIEDNLESGAVVTISLVHEKENNKPYQAPSVPMPVLSDREVRIIKLIKSEGPLGVTEINKLTDISNSTIYNALEKLKEANILEMNGKKRSLTEYGEKVAKNL